MVRPASKNLNGDSDAFDLLGHHCFNLNLHLDRIANLHDLAIAGCELDILVVLLPTLPEFIFVLKF